MFAQFLKYSVFCLIGLTVAGFSPVSASVGDKGDPSMSIPGIYIGELFLSQSDEPITIRLGNDGTLTYITTPELFKETSGVGSWARVSTEDGVDVIDIATVVYIQTDFKGFCKRYICVGYGGGRLSIDRDGEMMGQIEFSFRPAVEDDDPGVRIHLGPFDIILQKQSIEEIQSLAETPSTP